MSFAISPRQNFSVKMLCADLFLSSVAVCKIVCRTRDLALQLGLGLGVASSVCLIGALSLRLYGAFVLASPQSRLLTRYVSVLTVCLALATHIGALVGLFLYGLTVSNGLLLAVWTLQALYNLLMALMYGFERPISKIFGLAHFLLQVTTFATLLLGM